MRDLLDQIAFRLGYIPRREFDQIVDIDRRRIAELGDQLNLARAERHAATIACGKSVGALNDRLKTYQEAVRKYGLKLSNLTESIERLHADANASEYL